jgi:FdhD protein
VKIKRLHANARDTSPPARGRRIEGAKVEDVEWRLVEEVPVTFLVNGASFAVMMATPADLEDFALGFLLTERIIDGTDDLFELRIIEAGEGYAANCLLPAEFAERAEGRRRTLTGRSGCGLCGAETLEAAMPHLPEVSGDWPAPGAILRACDGLPRAQEMNAINRSTHAAAFCASDGTIDLVREDVGRHNALDKVAGALATKRRNVEEGFLLVSSRLSIELVQKAAIIGAPFIASISAPTALALRTAHACGMGVAARSGDAVVIFEPPEE